MTEPDYYLVRVSRALVTELLETESAPVVVVSVERNDDGTHDMVFRRVDDKVVVVGQFESSRPAISASVHL